MRSVSMERRFLTVQVTFFRHFCRLYDDPICFETCSMCFFKSIWPRIVTNFFLIKPTDAPISQIYFVKKLYMFRAVPLPIIRSFPLYIRHSFQARLVVLESCHQTCMTYTSAECTVVNCWWWAEELPKTCRVSSQDKLGNLVRLMGGGCGDWMELAQDRDRWRALVSTVVNIRVPKMWGISWLAAEPVSFSRRTLLHGVSK